MGKKKRKLIELFNDEDCDSKTSQLAGIKNKKLYHNASFIKKKKYDSPLFNNNHTKSGKQKYSKNGSGNKAETCNHSASVMKNGNSYKDRNPTKYISNSVDNIIQQRQGLPIYPIKDKLLSELKKGLSVIIIGETGSGKTTQIPQFLHEKGWDKNGTICITQPRRVAAISIAKRVAQETSTQLGGLVGYSVRFENVHSKDTKIKYVTDGMLLREALTDPLLSKYKWIVLDEAHERSIDTDILFGIVKAAQKERKELSKSPLHIVIMSATMDVDHFSNYFNSAKVLYIEGRQYPVDIFYAREKDKDYTLACMSTVFQIHKEAPAGDDILIFLTGQEEIESVVQALQQISKDPSLIAFPALKVHPLYAALPSQRQMDVFRRSSEGERKVIVSTNIAETSITLPGIKYVIDTGRSKVRTFNPTSGFDILKVSKISQAQSWQRSGRAGRERPGICYRTCTHEEFNSMMLNPVPEILRANLSTVILQLFAFGVTDVMNFDFLSKPSAEGIKEALSLLEMLNAIKICGKSTSLTALGKSMSIFPLEPRFSKVILSAVEYGCLEEILTIVSLLSGESIYVNPTNKRELIADVRRKFVAMEGDPVTYLKIYRAFKSSKESKGWCFSNFLNHRNLIYASKVKNQLKEICDKLGLAMESCGQNTEPILRCLISGLFTNIAELQADGKYISLRSRKEVVIHPTSVLFGSKPAYILFTELVKTGQNYMHANSSVDATWLIEENPEYFKTRHLRRPGK